MKRTLLSLATMLLSLLTCLSAQAHFLWIVSDPGTGQAKVYFGEAPEPDDPDLLEKLTGLKLLAFEGRDKVAPVEVAKEDDALVGKIGKAQAVGLSHRYGVLERGGEKFLLTYHAVHRASPIASDWKRLGNEQVPLEIVPSQTGSQVTLQAFWKGEPLAKAQVVVGGVTKAEGQTDADGKYSIEIKKPGLLYARAKFVEPEAGKLDSDHKQVASYDSIRHWTTLTVPVSLPMLNSIEHALPDVPQGITSFGGAISGDWAYVYGGHFGSAHHYWKEGQSGDLLRLNVNGGQQWEKLAGGPRRTGAALVAHGGNVYRIGGFEARNAEPEKADLHSMADVGRFDSATGKWEDFLPLPTPRSSHDAAILGDTLYVVGGWNLQPGGDGEFHETMLTLDLKAERPEWKPSAVPFKRRALSVAVRGGKLYALGGMQSEGSPTTGIDIFDPQSQTWSTGPALHGQPMEGFGTTAFEIGGKLTTITSSGAIQQLSADGKSWEISGYLKHPRFFARLLPLEGNRGIVIAGADMSKGKVTATEIIAPLERPPYQ